MAYPVVASEDAYIHTAIRILLEVNMIHSGDSEDIVNSFILKDNRMS